MPRGKPFVKGNTDGRAGRAEGTKNKVTQSMREAWMEAFNGIGGVPALIEWGQQERNKTAFYSLASKLIPMDITSGGEKLQVPAINLNQ